MAITEAMCTSFKQEVLEGVHNFKASGGHTFKIALYRRYNYSLRYIKRSKRNKL